MTDKGWLKFTYPDATEFQAVSAPIVEAGIKDGRWTQEIVDRIKAIK